MFISKWRYEKNLENARQRGILEGQEQVRERRNVYVEHLETENRMMKRKLEEFTKEVELLRMTLDNEAFPKKRIIETFANELACYQKMADVAWYVMNDQKESSRLLNNACVIKELANQMAIGGDVFERAYQIYDFRNSGKDGYTLKDGKIVKIEQEKPAVECPYVEEPAGETQENCTGDEITVCCPEVSDIPDSQENCCAAQETAGEEDFF